MDKKIIIKIILTLVISYKIFTIAADSMSHHKKLESTSSLLKSQKEIKYDKDTSDNIIVWHSIRQGGSHSSYSTKSSYGKNSSSSNNGSSSSYSSSSSSYSPSSSSYSSRSNYGGGYSGGK